MEALALTPLLDLIVDKVPPPEADVTAPLCLQVATLDYDDYLGYVAIGRISAGRTKVGDRYVVEKMRDNGFNLGGEQSGHIILSDYATTGDGIVAALQVLAVIVQSGKPASEVCKQFEPAPQILENVRYERGKPDPMDAATVKAANDVADDDLILDIGPVSVATVASRLASASTLVWNGPFGAFELARRVFAHDWGVVQEEIEKEIKRREAAI